MQGWRARSGRPARQPLFEETKSSWSRTASGTQLIQELQREGLYQIKAIKPQGDKVLRMAAQTPMIENGAVLLPVGAPWLATCEHELTTFPKGKHDDQVDSTAQVLAWISAQLNEPAIIVYYKQLQAQMEGRPISDAYVDVTF